MEYCGSLVSPFDAKFSLYYDMRLDPTTMRMRLTDFQQAWRGECATKDIISFIKSQGPKATIEDVIKWLGESLDDAKAEVSSSDGLVITSTFDYGRPYLIRLPPTGQIQKLPAEESRKMIVDLASSSLMDKKRLAEDLRREKQRSEALVKRLEKDLRGGKRDYEKLENELEQLKKESAAFLGRRQEVDGSKKLPTKPNPFDLILAHLASTQAATDQAPTPASAPAPAPALAVPSNSQPVPAPSSSAQVYSQNIAYSPTISQMNGSQASVGIPMARVGNQGHEEGLNGGGSRKRPHETAGNSLGPVVMAGGLGMNGRGKGGRGGGGRPKLG